MPEDRLRILSLRGTEFVTVSDPEERSTVGTYWNAVRTYLRSGDDSKLWQFEGETIADRPLETDLDAIEEWARRGEISFEDIYLNFR